MNLTVFIVLGLLTLAVLALLVVPLLRRSAGGVGRDRHSLEVYRDQLAEVERDAARGVLAPEEAVSAKREIERRILALDLSADTNAGSSRSRLTAVALIVLVPIAAAVLYGLDGAPLIPDQPFAERFSDDRVVADGGLTAGEVQQMIARLEGNLGADPDNVENWATLAGAYGLLEQYDEAAWAMGRATELDPGNAERHSLHGEFLVLAAGGIVSPDAQAAFEAAVIADPAQPVSRFYLALGRAQSGDIAGAMADWQALLAESPPGAPWAPIVIEQIERAAIELGIDPGEAVAGATPSGPSQDDVDAITGLPENEQMEMIRSMVDGLAARLAEEPDDLEGWSRLAQSYAVLQEWDKARDAYVHALSLDPNDRNLADGLANAVSGTLPQDGTVPADAAATYETVLEANPQNEQALYYLGVAALQTGDNARAVTFWTTLRDQLPEGTNQRSFIEARLQEIGG